MAVVRLVCGVFFIHALATSVASPQVADRPEHVTSQPPEALKEANENSDGSDQPSFVTVEDAPETSGDAPRVAAEDGTDGDARAAEESAGSEVKNTSAIVIACSIVPDAVAQPVELVNSTRLVSILAVDPNVTSRRTPADCAVVLFHARSCPFSSMAAPHFNALPRAYPGIKMVAVDAMKFHCFNTQYGIVGVPTLMLFHNGRPAAKFNESEYTLEAFSKFVNKYTGLEPRNMLFVKSADFLGPVSSVPTKETDYCLVLSWLFIAVCAGYFFGRSSWWRWLVEAALNTWRESEAHHEHDD
ncbi:thioredoxin domain-containing protein 15 [Bacillus rossius redtenbacheri]|uniref:thioredoxin domain-containing protein 15 n=1 Tax=Bacillus rossius redtenbacheri TaxID=93214 RepID=UPI002FDEDD9A